MAVTRFFDAHLDLAYLAENGRDMTRAPAEAGGPHPPAAVTFPELAAGGVGACLGTIFTEAGGDDAVSYPAGDGEAAHAAGVRQLERYSAWGRNGTIQLASSGADLVSGPHGTLRVGILMECADPIRLPEEARWWGDRGVIAVGMAWARGSRYATGNSPDLFSSGVGLTDLGRALADELDLAGIVHDASHLSDRAFDDLVSRSRGRVIASHSNCRALLENGADTRLPFRHLTDEQIREIDRRGGVIGLVLYDRFIDAQLEEGQRPPLDRALDHVEHICDLLGHRRGVGLGSDLDGGFSAARLPGEISTARDLPRLADALRARGWPPADVDAFAWGNWARFWSSPSTAPASR